MTATDPPSQEAYVSPRAAAAALTRTVSAGAIAGGLTGFLVGGVLGRLAMRLLAVTSPATAQGSLTDDGQVVGEVSLSGTFELAVFSTVVGVAGGLLYMWVRRVLPVSLSGRMLGYGVFSGAIGGALFVHDHPSFDYTMLAPVWLAVAMFVTLPLLYGVGVAAIAEALDRPSGLARRSPLWLIVAAGLLLSIPTLAVSAPVIFLAFVVALVPALSRAWRSSAVTWVGSALFVLLVLWGLYGLVADIISIAADEPSTLPLNP